MFLFENHHGLPEHLFYLSLFLIAVATIIGIFRWHLKTRLAILLVGIIASACSAAYFYLIDIKIGFMIVSASFIINILVLPFPNLNNSIKMFIGISSYAFATYLYGFSFLALIPIAAFTIGRIGSTMKEPNDIRKSYFVSSSCWMVFNIFNTAWLAVIVEVANIVSNGIAIYLHKKRELLKAPP